MDGCSGYVFHLAEARKHLLAHTPQHIIALCIRKQGDIDDGNIVDLHRFYHPSFYDGGGLIQVHGDSVMEFDQGIFAVFPHKKPYRDKGHVFFGHGVNILHAIDLPQITLQGRCHKLLDLLRAGAWGRYEHICHGNHNLGFFFLGGHHECGSAKAQGDDDQHD